MIDIHINLSAKAEDMAGVPRVRSAFNALKAACEEAMTDTRGRFQVIEEVRPPVALSTGPDAGAQPV